jgi:hypothetical protein
VIRDSKDYKGHEIYLDFLNVLLKDQGYVGLAYMTGILPIKKYKTESVLNMFIEYSMINPRGLASYVGFTEDEVSNACHVHGSDFEAMKTWYDGYRFGDMHIYSPMSVSNALKFKSIENYWTNTGTYESLKSYICMDFDGMKETVVQLLESPGYSKKIDPAGFQNDVHTFSSADDIFTLLVHLGYLGFDMSNSEVFIPNKEVQDVFKQSINDPVWAGLIEIHSISKELLEDTWNMNSAKVAEAIEKVHQKIVSIEKYNSEEALSYVISWAYIHANAYYTKLMELESGKGYLDILFTPKPQYASKLPLLIELKWNKSGKSAIAQIENKDYADKVKELAGCDILLIGINYSERTKKHTCKIKKLVLK